MKKPKIVKKQSSSSIYNKIFILGVLLAGLFIFGFFIYSMNFNGASEEPLKLKCNNITEQTIFIRGGEKYEISEFDFISPNDVKLIEYTPVSLDSVRYTRYYLCPKLLPKSNSTTKIEVISSNIVGNDPYDFIYSKNINYNIRGLECYYYIINEIDGIRYYSGDQLNKQVFNSVEFSAPSFNESDITVTCTEDNYACMIYNYYSNWNVNARIILKEPKEECKYE
jgi:hypothetical protein